MGPFDYLTALIQKTSDEAPKKGYHITRFETYRRLKDKLAAYDNTEKTGITVSGSQNLAKILGLLTAQLKDLSLPQYDVTKLDFPPESFDFIVSDQVLEHIRGDVPKLFRDLAVMLKPGGFMVHATPFIMDMHPAPFDCWRFTPDGLKWLAEQAGLEVIEADGWGNRAAWLYIMLGHRMTPVPDDENHPTFKLATYNEKHYPINVWIICRKPLASSVQNPVADQILASVRAKCPDLTESEVSAVRRHAETGETLYLRCRFPHGAQKEPLFAHGSQGLFIGEDYSNQGTDDKP